MRALANGAATDGADPADDIELAELIGRLKSLSGVLVSLVDR